MSLDLGYQVFRKGRKYLGWKMKEVYFIFGNRTFLLSACKPEGVVYVHMASNIEVSLTNLGFKVCRKIC